MATSAAPSAGAPQTTRLSIRLPAFPFAGNMIPANRIAPQAQKILGYFPPRESARGSVQ